MNTVETSILRVLRDEEITGAAFPVSDELVATCAHVVEAVHAGSGGKIVLRSFEGRELAAASEPSFWRSSQAEDIAILRLAKPLDQIAPLRLGSSAGTKGHHFSTFGFPRPGQELSGGGEIVGQALIDGRKVLQLRSPEITPGFSGAPIFDEVAECVVGMVLAITPPDEYQRLGTTAFAVPAEVLQAVCPELKVRKGSIPDPSAESEKELRMHKSRLRELEVRASRYVNIPVDLLVEIKQEQQEILRITRSLNAAQEEK